MREREHPQPGPTAGSLDCLWPAWSEPLPTPPSDHFGFLVSGMEGERRSIRGAVGRPIIHAHRSGTAPFRGGPGCIKLGVSADDRLLGEFGK